MSDPELDEYFRARRANRLASLMFVGAGLAVVAGLIGVAVVANAGMSTRTLEELGRAEDRALALSTKQKQCEEELQALVEQDQAYMASVSAVQREIGDVQAFGKANQERVAAAEQFMPMKEHWFVSDQDDRAAQRAAVEVWTSEAVDCTQPKETLSRVLSYKKDVGSWKERLDAVGAALDERQGSAWLAKHSAVARRWPGLKEPIAAMKDDLRAVRDELSEAHVSGLAAHESEDFYTLGETVLASELALAALDAVEKADAEDLDSVGDNVDIILADYRTSPEPAMRRLTIRGQEVTTGDWEKIGTADPNLAKLVGLVMLHKPPGQLMSTAEGHPTPPGWHYVDDRRYGSWTGDEPEDTWTFNAKSQWMKAAYWGSEAAYRPVNHAEYSAFTSAREAGSVYLGLESGKNVYGTAGTWTRSRFGTATAVMRVVEAERELERYRAGYGSGGYRSSGSRSGYGGSRGYGGFGK